MKSRRRLIFAAVAGTVVLLLGAGLPVGVLWIRGVWPTGSWVTNELFVVEPYIQLGDAPAPASNEQLELHWLATDHDAQWSVEVQRKPESEWTATDPPSVRRVALETAPPFRLARVAITGLVPGAEFDYRVRHDGVPVFQARARSRRPAGQPHRFVAFGDCGAGSPEQAKVAYQTWLAHPDYVMITGDIVYTQGRVVEYLKKFFPAYNREKPSPQTGGPLMRSTLFMAAPGNHDLILNNLDTAPDGLAYFYFWSQPLNGPVFDSETANPLTLHGTPAHRQPFLDLAGPAFPRMANFSFDYGGAHWTILDANTYVDLTAAALRNWLEHDLAAAQTADWRFVAFHHPPFNSSKAHHEDQRTRALVALFEKWNVDLVFTGHVHNYQRTHPLRFVAAKQANGLLVGPNGQVDGRWELDSAYDGKTHTRPNGIIYLVTGAGGARLYNPDQNDVPTSWQPFTARFVSNVHSLTVVDLEPTRLLIRQVSADGAELDRFTITKPPAKAEPRPAATKDP
jgi:hypothetical protein